MFLEYHFLKKPITVALLQQIESCLGITVSPTDLAVKTNKAISPPMHGLHILAELRHCQCPKDLLQDPEQILILCRESCATGTLTIVAEAFHQFGTTLNPAGVTGAMVLAESHLAVHTWPEVDASGAVTVDLYVCNFSRDNRLAAERTFQHLVNAFQPERVDRQDVQRGSLGE